MSILELRVRYQETDQGGRVYHGNYFTWLDMARTEYLRERGCNYKELEDQGIMLVVAETSAKYLSSVGFDDQIRITTKLTEIGNVTVSFAYEIYNLANQLLICTATTKLGAVAKSGKIVKIPPAVIELLKTPSPR